jgi:hypothetical protein
VHVPGGNAYFSEEIVAARCELLHRHLVRCVVSPPTRVG